MQPKSKKYEATIRIPRGYAFHAESTTGVRTHEKVMPNDPCPCGSLKKAKKCCFKNSKVVPDRKIAANNLSDEADGKE